MAIDLSEAIKRPWERVAQPVEHVTFNHGVLGSSPSGLTKDNKDFPHKSSIHEMRWAHRK